MNQNRNILRVIFNYDNYLSIDEQVLFSANINEILLLKNFFNNIGSLNSLVISLFRKLIQGITN